MKHRFRPFLACLLVLALLAGMIPPMEAKAEGLVFRGSQTIAVGSVHSLALKSDGTVWAWGNNNNGQLGDGTTTSRSTPVQVQSLKDVVAIAGEYYHPLALKSDGTVWAWGDNFSGQLGDGTTTSRSTPVQVQNLKDVVAITGGTIHSLALTSDGTVWAWGDNRFGQLGDGTTIHRTAPVQVQNLTDVVAIAGGTYHSLALKSDGTVWAWGNNGDGQLGDGTTTSRSTPVQVQNLKDVVAIAGGDYYSLALKSDGTVWAWGNNVNGQLGDGTTTRRYTPVQVQNLTDVVAIAGGTYHSLALKSDGTVWAWGNNVNGQLGDGTTTRRYTPVQVQNLTDVVAIAAGFAHSLALKSDGTVWAWGSNNFGQLGDGTTTQRNIPVQAQISDVRLPNDDQDPGSSLPNLSVKNVTYQPTSPVSGQSVTIHVTIENIGSQPANNFTVKLKENGNILESNTVEDLAGASTTEVTFTHTFDSPGTYNLKIIVDEEGAVEESDENNNSHSFNITVGQGQQETPDPVVTPGKGQLLVEWNYPDDERVVGAKVSLHYEGNLAQGPVTVNRPENSHLFTGLDSDKNYTVRVVYVYDDGTESEPGEEVGTPEPMEPPAPTEPPVTEPSEDGKSLTVTWEDPDHPAFTGVHLYIRPLDGEYGSPVYVAPGVERYTFTGLTPGKSYAVKYSFLYGDVEIPGEETEVTMPVGDKGNPGGSDPESGEDPGNNDPGNGGNQPPFEPEKPITLRSPVLKLVNNSREGVTLEANEVENGQVYILKRKTGSEDYAEVARQDATGTGKVTFTDTTIELKTTYSYVVEVQNGNAKAESNKVTVTTPVPEDEVPFSETPVLKVTAKTADSITLEGTPIERATEYILMKKQSDGTFAEIARKSAGEVLVFVDTGLQEKTTYTYRLAATNGKVTAQSPLVSATTEAMPPQTPIIVTAKLVGTEAQGFVKMLIQGFMRLMGLETDEGPAVEVEWSDPSVKPQAYVVYRQVNNGVIIQVKTIQQGQGTLYRDEQVEEGKTYTYYVEALKDGMRSEKAASNSVTVPVSEKNKRGWDSNPLTVEQTGPNQVTVSWIPAGGQPDKYFLYRIDTANPLYKKSIKVLTGDVTEHVDNTVTKGKTYIYVIKAVYRDGPTNEHTDEFQSEPITIQ